MKPFHKFCLSLIVLFFSSAALARRAPKPTMCDDFEEIKTAHGTVALCHADRPKVLVRYTIVTVAGHRVAVGYQSAE